MSTAASLFSLKGKVALITGGSSGLGAHFAHVLAANGADVILAARREDKLASVVESVAALKKTIPDAGSPVALPLDVSADEATIAKAIEEAWSKFGHIDILVNNAGVFRGGVAVTEETVEDWDVQFSVNVKAVWLVSRALVSKLVAAGATSGASIVNISSAVGNPGAVAPGVTTYTATKATVQQLTRNLALEFGKFGVRVNSISPGVFPSEMSAGIVEPANAWHKDNNPVPRIGDTEHDLDGPLLLLASDAGAYITGTNVTVDGGLSILAKSFFG